MVNNNPNKPKWILIKYGAGFLTIFFALALLTGRISMQSYWNEYGLSLDIVNSSFMNFAIASPNTTIASILIAAITVMLWASMEKFVIFFKDLNRIVLLLIGLSIFTVGLLTIGYNLFLDQTGWPNGLAGLVYGIGYFCFILGTILMTATSHRFVLKENSTTKNQFYMSLKFSTIMLVVASILVIYGTVGTILTRAEKFGIADAHNDYNKKPLVTLQIDSSNGFGDLAYTLNDDETIIKDVKMITEFGDFLYISSNTTFPLVVYLIPISRVQSIVYTSNITK
jgi:hypothetical protein